MSIASGGEQINGSFVQQPKVEEVETPNKCISFNMFRHRVNESENILLFNTISIK